VLGSRWAQKPPAGTASDRSHSLAQGLVFLAPLWDYGGGAVNDAIGGLVLPITAASWAVGATSGLSFTAATQYAQVATPGYLQLPGPMSIAVGYRVLSTSASNAPYFGTSYAATNVSPFNGVNIGMRFNGAIALFYNGSTASGTVPTVGVDYVSSGSVSSAAAVLYTNGVQAGTAAGAAVTYSASSLLAIGANTAFARNPAVLVYWAALWNRALSATEHARLGGDVNAIWRIFAPQRDVIRSYLTTAGTGVSYPRGSSILRPVQVPTADLTCYLD
jgi:hypothetical protein